MFLESRTLREPTEESALKSGFYDSRDVSLCVAFANAFAE